MKNVVIVNIIVTIFTLICSYYLWWVAKKVKNKELNIEYSSFNLKLFSVIYFIIGVFSGLLSIHGIINYM